MRLLHVFRSTLAFVFLAFAAGAVSAADTQQTANAEIEHLLRFVGGMEGAVFIRNGSEHTCREAQAHMSLKRSSQAKAIKTAEQFIELCATKSLISGEHYQIRPADGTVHDSAAILLAELERLRSSSQTD